MKINLEICGGRRLPGKSLKTPYSARNNHKQKIPNISRLRITPYVN